MSAIAVLHRPGHDRVQGLVRPGWTRWPDPARSRSDNRKSFNTLARRRTGNTDKRNARPPTSLRQHLSGTLTLFRTTRRPKLMIYKMSDQANRSSVTQPERRLSRPKRAMHAPSTTSPRKPRFRPAPRAAVGKDSDISQRPAEFSFSSPLALPPLLPRQDDDDDADEAFASMSSRVQAMIEQGSLALQSSFGQLKEQSETAKSRRQSAPLAIASASRGSLIPGPRSPGREGTHRSRASMG